MKTVLLNEAKNEWGSSILSGYRFQPYWWIRQVDAASRQALMWRDLQQLEQDDTVIMIGLYADQKPDMIGFAAIRPLAWDSAHFGIDVWRLAYLGTWGDAVQQQTAACVLAQAVRNEAFQRGAQTVHGWMPLDALPAIHALEAVGFQTMESQVYWLFDFNRQPVPPKKTDVHCRPYEPADRDACVALARRSYTPIPNRFHADPHLPNDLCDELYAEWISNSCKGDEADYMSVIDVEGEVVGYVTLRYLDDQDGLCNKRLGQFMLGALDPDHRARGIYDDMLRVLLVWLADHKADIAYVGTQTNNVASQIGMARMGFKPMCSGLSLHLWRGR